MNTLQTLLESANPYHSLQSDAARLASKWGKTGLLEGLSGDIEKNNMSVLLENQAKQLVTEASLSGGGVAGGSFTAGTGEQWAGVALPMVRKVFGQIAAKEFVSVQPMNLPSGLAFYLDFKYGTTKSPFTLGESLYGKTGSAQFPFGNTNDGGLYGAGRFGYSVNNTSSVVAATTGAADWSNFNYNSDYSASAAAGGYNTVTVTLPTTTDPLAARSFIITSGSLLTVAANLPEFTTVASNGSNWNVTFLVSGSVVPNQGDNVTVTYSLQPTDNRRGDFEDGNTTLNVNNNPISIPELNVQMRSEAIVAKTRKLKAQWTPEFAQDLNAYQNLDAEAELTSLMSEYISLEIDMEILDMLITEADTTEYWSAENNTFIDTNGVAVKDVTGGGYYNSQGLWFQTFGTKLQKISNVIHQKTLRGGANFLVVSPLVATILESIPGFASTSDGDASKMKYAFGIQKAGQLNGRYQVYKNPYMNENTVLVGYKGSQFLESGAVFAPYIPLIMTPLVYDPDTFTPRKGVLTRYAKKMLRPEFYGKIYVAGLNTL